VSARGYTDATVPVTLTASQVADVRLLLPLARLLDVGGSSIRCERVANGYQMFANAINTGSGRPAQVTGVLTIMSTAPPHLALDFSWSVPPERIIVPGEQFEYRVGFMSNEQAFAIPEGSARSVFSSAAVLCP